MSLETAKPATQSAIAKGLKGVSAGESAICLVDGATGKLLYRGYDIDSLAENSTFEEVTYLLLAGELPNAAQLKEFDAALRRARALPPEVDRFIRSLPKDAQPMSALRSAVSVAGLYDPHADDESPEANYQKAIRLTSQVATIVAAIHRTRVGLEPLSPDPGLGFAANFMYLLNGRKPTADEARAMDLILILHAEHGYNASTFAARVICATLTDMYSAITGAIGALKGKLHGGANTEVIKTLIEIDSVENVPGWVESMIARKQKFMGFGHAVYVTEDPRAKHLKKLSKRLGEEQNDTRWYDISVALEKLITPAIGKNCNVDFYSASLQHYMGIPRDLFTCIFAASRIAGWCAHVLEQYADNKIIRPSSSYVGPAERRCPPLSKR